MAPQSKATTAAARHATQFFDEQPAAHGARGAASASAAAAAAAAVARDDSHGRQARGARGLAGVFRQRKARTDAPAAAVEKLAVPAAVSDARRVEVERFKEALRAAHEQTKAARRRAREEVEEGLGRAALDQCEEEEVRRSVSTSRNVLVEGVSKEEEAVIHQRVLEHQLRFKRFEKRDFAKKVLDICEMHPHVTDDEAQRALRQCKNNEQDALCKLYEPHFLHAIRKEVAHEHMAAHAPAARAALTAQEREEFEEKRVLYEERQRRRKTKTAGRTKSRNGSGYVRTRLPLDEALKRADFEGWSPARVKAYKQIDTNPNAYYYRFNAPGERQINGVWNTHERALFMKRMAEVGVSGQWGIFSMTIPGRVGYQCSNFYRLLLERREIVDPNYYIDERGKAHYLFKSKRAPQGKVRTYKRKQPSGASVSPKRARTTSRRKSAAATTTTATTTTTTTTAVSSASASPSRPKRSTRTRRRFFASHSDDDSDDDTMDGFTGGYYTYRPRSGSSAEGNNTGGGGGGGGGVPTFSVSDAAALLSESEDESDEEEDDPANPLPGVVDPITLGKLRKPAISPYGHVMSYDSWSRCLQANGGVCPMTKKPLKKRQLVVLTHDNIEEYRDLIIQ